MFFINAYRLFDMYIDKDLRIQLSRYPQKEIAFDNIQKKFVPNDENDFLTIKAKIRKYGTKYKIYFGNNKLCVKRKEIKNNGECYWDVLNHPFGYIFSKDDSCLTLNDKLKLDRCNRSNSQVFNFKFIESCNKTFDVNEEADDDNEIKELEKKYNLKDKPKIKKLLSNLQKIRKKKKRWWFGSYKGWFSLFC